jgi:ribosomal protein S18 acetylase RimI-like enzyme
MRIRRAELADLNACVEMDRSYSTDYVWQVDERSREDEISVAFRKAKLPRTAQVRLPGLENGLLSCWQQDECFIVADDPRILGFLDMPIAPEESLARLRYLLVGSAHRRKGVGSALLTSAMAWAREQGISGVLVETETRNFPAISFLQRHGFTFCGYCDQLSINRGIRLFFIQALR